MLRRIAAFLFKAFNTGPLHYYHRALDEVEAEARATRATRVGDVENEEPASSGEAGEDQRHR